MNQWTNSDKDPRAQDAYGAPPWVEQKRTAERVGKKKSGSRGGVVALAIALVAALLVAFGAGFGSVYGLEKLADEYAYVFRRSSNPTFTKPKDERDKEESVPSPEEPSEPKAPASTASSTPCGCPTCPSWMPPGRSPTHPAST